MDFLALRGQDFKEHFDFKNEQGKPLALPPGQFKITLVRGGYAREYTVENGGLRRNRTQVLWNIDAEETKDFAYNTLYYTLYLDDKELSRGIVRVR